MGTSRHQMTIMNVRLGINEEAHAVAAPGEPPPWYALSQMMIIGFVRPDGSRYTTLPDVFVYLHAIALDRGSVVAALDGPPVLIIEVASESTYASDLDLEAGKGWTYAHAGVREYLVLDPTGLYVPDGGRGWRLEDSRYQPWRRAARGRWQSRELPLAFGVEDALATVYGGTGEPQLHEGEVAVTVGRMREQLARQAEELAELRRRLQTGE